MKKDIAGSVMITTASEDFKKNLFSRKRYVDKTQVLIPLLDMAHETTFFLRPRRFGKTLMLSMIRYFLEDTGNEEVNAENRSLFEGMKIMEAGSFYTDQMTAFPVIHLNFQIVYGNSYQDAYDLLLRLLQELYNRHRDILSSDALSEPDKAFFRRVWMGRDPVTGEKTPEADYQISLRELTRFLHLAHGKRPIVLIDEYDVPLEKAYQKGYYSQMVGVISSLLQGALKGNSENLQFAVVTGCLRIAKESIYTGLNNPEINTVTSYTMSDVLGFTEKEVKDLLEENGLSDRYAEVKTWYDGYLFGNTVIYNPWSLIKFIENAKAGDPREPGVHWANTSDNAIIKTLASKASEYSRRGIEELIAGGTIDFPLNDNIVYSELEEEEDNIFNVMLNTGYLTPLATIDKSVRARIPNQEVEWIFQTGIKGWFKQRVQKFDVTKLYGLMLSEEGGREITIQEILEDEFLSSIRYWDTKEAYYHGILYTLLSLHRGFQVDRNREAGRGRFDLACKGRRLSRDPAIVLEVKISKSAKNLTADAKRGAKQNKTQQYAKEMLRIGYQKVYSYGISFFEKLCHVAAGPVYTQEDLSEGK